MPKQQKRNRRAPARGRDRQLSIRSELRREPDLRKIAGTVIALAMAQAEAEAQAKRESEAAPDAI